MGIDNKHPVADNDHPRHSGYHFCSLQKSTAYQEKITQRQNAELALRFNVFHPSFFRCDPPKTEVCIKGNAIKKCYVINRK